MTTPLAARFAGPAAASARLLWALGGVGAAAACGASGEGAANTPNTSVAATGSPASAAPDVVTPAKTWALKASVKALAGDSDGTNAQTLPPTLILLEVADAAASMSSKSQQFQPPGDANYAHSLVAADCATQGGSPALPCTYTFSKLDLSAYTGGLLMRLSDNRPSFSGPAWRASFAYVPQATLDGAQGGSFALGATAWSSSAASAVATGAGLSLPDMQAQGGILLRLVDGASPPAGIAGATLTPGTASGLTQTYPGANLSGTGTATSSLGLVFVTSSSAGALRTTGWVGKAGSTTYPVPQIVGGPNLVILAEVAAGGG